MSSKLSCVEPLSTHVISRSHTTRTAYFRAISMATVWSVHVATFEMLIAHESMFHIVRIVVDYISIIDTYRVIQTRCRSSVSYSACVIVSVVHS